MGTVSPNSGKHKQRRLSKQNESLVDNLADLDFATVRTEHRH